MALRWLGFAVVGLLLNACVASPWEVQQGTVGNELVLELRNSSRQALKDISVKVDESPRWVSFGTKSVTISGTLEPGEKQTARFVFAVAQELSPQTEGKVSLLVGTGGMTWRKEVLLTVVPAVSLPLCTALDQSFPNPFHDSAIIRYQLSGSARACLRVYDVAGELVKILVDEEKPAGVYQVEWRGEGECSETLPNGTYFYILTADRFNCSKKLTLLR